MAEIKSYGHLILFYTARFFIQMPTKDDQSPCRLFKISGSSKYSKYINFTFNMTLINTKIHVDD